MKNIKLHIGMLSPFVVDICLCPTILFHGISIKNIL